ncbi:hypothetical protein [Tardiphaga sp. 839_C3_N1_4]|uniref:hypothetical protein n=1 Tax=Tardiphaga sp. 839_C3_N1_4 TaxID=3240761 RepID=UPI003F26DFB5
MADIARIEDRIDRVAVGALEVSDALGGLRFQNMVEVMEFAKCMAIADTAVPKHLRGNPGMCLAVCVQALEWRFSPFAVANKSYVVNDRIGYESQLVHAVIEQRAPIIGRLKHKFDGEGEDRRCIVSATLRETGETLEYISPPFSKIQPKNSPLWKTKPDLQLYYNTSRDFCRAYFPDVLLGVYSQEELRDHVGPDNAKPVGDRPNVGDRLKGNRGRGFNASHVERESRGGVVEDHPATGGASTQTDLREQESKSQVVDTVTTPVVAAQDDQAGEMPAAESLSSDAPQGQTDTPAADAPIDAAGTQSELPVDSIVSGNVAAQDVVSGGHDVLQPTDEPSTLAPDWQETYLKAMARVNDRPRSLQTRHNEALQLIGGKANASEQEWMKAVYRLTERRLRCEISKDDCDAAIREIS